MKKYRAIIKVQKIKTVANPEGKTIQEALKRLGYNNVDSLRTGKIFLVDMHAEDLSMAEKIADEISKEILSNPIIEEYEIELEEVQ